MNTDELLADLQRRRIAHQVRGVNVQALEGGTAPSADIDEESFMAAVIALAKRNGWRHFHPRDSRKSAAGWPDLVLCRERFLLAELKTDVGRLTAEQRTWIEALEAAGVIVHVWRPSDWETIVQVLTAPVRPRPITPEGGNETPSLATADSGQRNAA